MRDRLFVYGTLMPGHLRWPMLRPWAVDVASGTLPGTLYDTGNGWPAAVIDATCDGRVPGFVVDFGDHRPDHLWAQLDAMEGIGDPPSPSRDPYVRRLVEVSGVGEAWVYDATRVEPGWVAIEGWTNQPEA